MTGRAGARRLAGALVVLSWGVAAAGAESPSAAPPQSPAVGDKFPAFDAEGLDGVAKHIDDRKASTTVFLFFLSGCPVCHKMIPEWNRAYERRANGVQVIGVLMDKEPPGFFMAMPISFPVVRSPGLDFLRGRNVNRAPLTLRVVAGVVKDVGLGQIDAIRLGEIFRP